MSLQVFQGESVYDTVLFISPTPQSELAKLLQKHEILNNQGRESWIRIVVTAMFLFLLVTTNYDDLWRKKIPLETLKSSLHSFET